MWNQSSQKLPPFGSMKGNKNAKSKVSEYGSQISADSSQSDHASMGSQAVSASSKLFNRKKTNAAHGKDKPGAGALQQFAIFDEEGNDITPRPMFNRPPAMPRPLDNKDAPKGSRSVLNASTAALSIKRTLQESLLELQQPDNHGQPFGFGLSLPSSISRSMLRSQGSIQEVDQASESSAGAGSGDEETLAAKQRFDGRLAFKKHENPEAIITLSETSTISLLDLPSIVAGVDPIEEAQVRESNRRYNEHMTSDNYVHRGMQTFNNVLKNKDVQVVFVKHSNAECQANTWDIHDLYETEENKRTDDPAMMALISKDSFKTESSTLKSRALIQASFDHSTQSAMMLQSTTAESGVIPNSSASTLQTTVDSNNSDSSFLRMDSGSVGMSLTKNTIEGGAYNHHQTDQLLKKIDQQALLRSLNIMERAIVQNISLRKLVSYHDMPDIRPYADEFDWERLERGAPPADKAKPVDKLGSTLPSVTMLWSFKSDLTKGRSINGMVFNTKDPNILAVAYGRSPFAANGLILCWSLKNLEYPERIFKVSVPVTALAFSTLTPNLLAAGCADGRLSIYDVQQTQDSPILTDTGISKRHYDPIWELKWVNREHTVGNEQARVEYLYSVSADGRVLEWSIKKGLESFEIMALKRVVKESNKPTEKKGSAFVSHLSGGLSIDFNSADLNLYLVGTEEGNIHRCSRNYQEQYLDTIFAHNGPIYRISWSPFQHDVFISCGADWGTRVWLENTEKPVFEFQNNKAAINDVVWSPHCSSVFGSVSDDGRLEIWDLSHSQLNPIIIHSVLDHSLKRLLFAPKDPCIITGDDNGAIMVYKFRNFANSKPGREAVTAPSSADSQSQLLLRGLIDSKLRRK